MYNTATLSIFVSFFLFVIDILKQRSKRNYWHEFHIDLVLLDIFIVPLVKEIPYRLQISTILQKYCLLIFPNLPKLCFFLTEMGGHFPVFLLVVCMVLINAKSGKLLVSDWYHSQTLINFQSSEDFIYGWGTLGWLLLSLSHQCHFSNIPTTWSSRPGHTYSPVCVQWLFSTAWSCGVNWKHALEIMWLLVFSLLQNTSKWREISGSQL